MSQLVKLADGEKLSSNPLNVIFQWVRITHHPVNLWRTSILQGAAGADGQRTPGSVRGAASNRRPYRNDAFSMGYELHTLRWMLPGESCARCRGIRPLQRQTGAMLNDIAAVESQAGSDASSVLSP